MRSTEEPAEYLASSITEFYCFGMEEIGHGPTDIKSKRARGPSQTRTDLSEESVGH
jgi:hypothetical protein